MSKQTSTTSAAPDASPAPGPLEVLAREPGAAKAASLKMFSVLAGGLETLRAAAHKIRGHKEAAPVEAGEAAADVVVKAQKAAKLAGDHCREQLAPLTARMGEVKSTWGVLLDGFREVERDMKALADEVLTKLREEHARQEREARERAEAAERKQQEEVARAKAAATPEEEIAASVRAAEAYTDVQAARADAPKGPAPNVLRSSTGASLHGRERWDFEILDVAAVPDEYTHRVVNAEAVVKAIAGGARTIPGLRIFSTAVVARGAAKR